MFEEHLPELTPIYSAEVRLAVWLPSTARRRPDIWRVLAVENGQAHCLTAPAAYTNRSQWMTW